jgi:hypothetical protein
MKPTYNIASNEYYSIKVLENLKNKVLEKGMSFDFPDFIGERCIKANRNKEENHHYSADKNDKKQQVTLMTYM